MAKPKRDDNIATITDRDWQKLQARALKANPHLLDSFSDDAVRRTRAAAERYAKRGEN